MAEATKKTRKPRTNFAATHAKLVQYCRISIRVMPGLEGPENINSEYMHGQITALKAVLAELGEKEGEA